MISNLLSSRWRAANALALAFLAAILPQSAFAQASAFEGPLRQALCLVSGRSMLVAFVAGVAIVIFFVVLALNEGNAMVSWGLKILIGVAGLIGATSLLQYFFPGLQAIAC